MTKKHCDLCDSEIVAGEEPSYLIREARTNGKYMHRSLWVRCFFTGDASRQLELCNECANEMVTRAFEAERAVQP